MDESDSQAQIDELRERTDAAEGAAGTHGDRIDENHEAIGDLQKAGIVDRSDIDALQVGAEADRVLIAELQAEGVLRADHAEQMQEALAASRRIGAAIGVIVAQRQVSEEEAFAILARASQNSNRKVRDLADDIVQARRY